MPDPLRNYDRFYICGLGEHEKAPDHALFVASHSAVMERILDSKARRNALSIINDAEHAKGQLQTIRERERALRVAEDAFRADVAAFDQDILQQLLDRIAALETQLTAIEAARTQQKLDSLPDIDDPASYEPGGELHSVAPKQPQATTDQGDLPNELVRKAPPTLGTDPVTDPRELAHGPGPAPPVAISLNAADDD